MFRSLLCCYSLCEPEPLDLSSTTVRVVADLGSERIEVPSIENLSIEHLEFQPP